MTKKEKTVHDLTVADIMSTDLVTLEETENLALAEEIMKLGRIRHLPVVRGKELVGIVTHRDILRASFSALAEIDPGEESAIKSSIPVREIMNADVASVPDSMSLLDAAQSMLNHKYGCLPIVNGGKQLVGLITEADFVKLIVDILKKM